MFIINLLSLSALRLMRNAQSFFLFNATVFTLMMCDGLISGEKQSEEKWRNETEKLAAKRDHNGGGEYLSW